jgi:pSer/pThr/pTyr-binding forkhead associated (FHA) protein
MQSIHRLVVLDEKGSHEFVLDRPIYSVGRDPQCDITLNSGFASRYHATLIQQLHQTDIFSYRIVDGNYQFVDGELIGKPSVNGMWVNGRKQEIHYLRHGDEIILGLAEMVYYFEPPPSISDENPLDPNSYQPRKPYPFTPNFGTEALPDAGFSRIP